MRLPGVEPGSIAWKAIILTVGLQTLVDNFLQKLIYNGNEVAEEFVETEYYKDLNSVDKHHHTVITLTSISYLLLFSKYSK